MNKIDLNKVVTYDLETLRNCITGCFTDYVTKKKKEFVLFDDINEFHKLLKFLKQIRSSGYTMVSFNGIGFDNQLVEFILENGNDWIDWEITIEEVISEIYGKAQWIIALPEDEKFKHLLPEYKFTIPVIDLYKQKHYDRMQRATSLKWLQFSMRYPNIEEMPIHHESIITKEDIPKILGYNWNDVDSTEAFFDKIKFETDLRLTLQEKFGGNLINAAEPRLAREIFGKFLCEQMGLTYKELKDKRTFRKTITVKNIIFPYVKFKSPELNVILNSFRQLILNPNEKMDFKYEFNYGGIDTVLGLGGIHACCKAGNYKATGDNIIHDIDVVSFYPKLAIENGLKPAHLGDVFTKVYNQIFNDRIAIPKKDPMNYVYKIILNSTYGLSNEKNSYLYDPQFTMGITINGQLSILMLVEMLLAKIPDLKIYQENTDGITIGYDKKYLELVRQICADWCSITKLSVEEAFYNQMIINDVNNYIGVYDDGKVKKKGLFETELDFHKNPSFLIIPKALEAYFVHGKDFREFIMNHDDIFDFCGGVKVKSSFKLNIYSLDKDTNEVVADHQQKVTRFYVSTDGGRMIKDFNKKNPHDPEEKERQTSVLKDWLVTSVNRIEDPSIKNYPNIDYRFYIKEVEKVIHAIEGNANQLKLF